MPGARTVRMYVNASARSAKLYFRVRRIPSRRAPDFPGSPYRRCAYGHGYDEISAVCGSSRRVLRPHPKPTGAQLLSRVPLTTEQLPCTGLLKPERSFEMPCNEHVPTRRWDAACAAAGLVLPLNGGSVKRSVVCCVGSSGLVSNSPRVR